MTPAFIIDKFDERILKTPLQFLLIYDIIYSTGEMKSNRPVAGA